MASRASTSKQLSALLRATSTSGDGFNGNRFLVDTPEKKLCLAVIERAVKDLLLLRKRKHFAKYERNQDFYVRKLTLEDHISYFFDYSKDEWSLFWVLEQISFDPESEFKKLQKIAQAVIDWEPLPDTYLYKNKFGSKELDRLQ